MGRKLKDGKSTGGIKVHSIINADERVPSLVWLSEAKTHDHKFLDKLKLGYTKKCKVGVFYGVYLGKLVC